MQKKVVMTTLFLGFFTLILGFYAYLHRYTPETFIFLSGFDMEHSYTKNSVYTTYMASALEDVSHAKTAVVMHASLGHSEQQYALTQGTTGVPNEGAHNTLFFADAKKTRVPAFLNIRLVNNALALNAENLQTVTFEEIASNPSVQEKYLQKIDESVSLYAGKGSPYEKSCTIILGEDETPYHRRDGGGAFWLGSSFPLGVDGKPLPTATPSTQLDTIYIDNYSRLYTLLVARIEKINPACRIGIYIGPSNIVRTIQNHTLLEEFYMRIGDAHQPDIIMFHLYSKMYPTFAEYESVLRYRMNKLRSITPRGTLFFFIAQLHTTNHVGTGMSRTPSLEQLEATIALARELEVDGFGYLGKDHHATHDVPLTEQTVTVENKEIKKFVCAHTHPDTKELVTNAYCSPAEDSNPFAPNSHAQRLLFYPDELSGLKRWYKGLQLLSEFTR
ncbi:MAG: hypothetical protein WAY88_03215 [Minisyncoccia bacterium]